MAAKFSKKKTKKRKRPADRLRAYRAKRDFGKTPEPAGDEARTKRGRARTLKYCIQKHQATALHYDLRLEHNGVLLSWAVPRGPSLDPRDKRLAMQTEDHPLEYGNFEGVIPEGYGAGVVLLWDRGTWQPDLADNDSVEGALGRGDLKFTLKGKKLRGKWVLVRTQGRGSRSWLLIKKRDDFARDKKAAVEDLDPRSAKSNGNFADIILKNRRKITEALKGGEAATLKSRLARALQDAAGKKSAK